MWQAGWQTCQASLQLCFSGTRTSWEAGQEEQGWGGGLREAEPRGLPPSPSQLGDLGTLLQNLCPDGHPAHSGVPAQPGHTTASPVPNQQKRRLQTLLETPEGAEREHHASGSPSQSAPRSHSHHATVIKPLPLILRDVGHPSPSSAPTPLKARETTKQRVTMGKGPNSPALMPQFPHS